MAALNDLLERVFAAEPPPGDAVDAVFRHAEALRRRRLRGLIAAGVVAVLLVAGLGYGLTTVLLPGTVRRAVTPTVTPVGTPVDPALLAVRAAVDRNLRVVPREPARGPGWRRFTVLSRDSGRPRGIVEVSVYSAPAGLCFPVLSDRAACARPDRLGADVEYVRYTADRDPNWQVNQAITRRLTNGRVITVLATGERGTGDAEAGRPPLSAVQTVTLAADGRLIGAFGADETCNGRDSTCPLLTVPVPTGG